MYNVIDKFNNIEVNMCNRAQEKIKEKKKIPTQRQKETQRNIVREKRR